jgi:hypothetical protein
MVGSCGFGRHAKRRARLFATATGAVCLGLILVSTTGVQKTYGATNKVLPPMPVCAFDFSSTYAPSAGDTVSYTLSFAICKTLNLTVEEIIPKQVTKVEAVAASDKNPDPTRYVHGNPVWVKKYSWRAHPNKTIRLTFANNLHTGQKVTQKFIFSAHGYRPDVEVATQTIYNP